MSLASSTIPIRAKSINVRKQKDSVPYILTPSVGFGPVQWFGLYNGPKPGPLQLEQRKRRWLRFHHSRYKSNKGKEDGSEFIIAVTNQTKKKEGAQERKHSHHSSSLTQIQPIAIQQRRRRESTGSSEEQKNSPGSNREATWSSGSHHCSSLEIDLASRSKVGNFLTSPQ